ncbi:inactive ubiquitin thioesterase OTULINL isoform X3 [Bufo gargarizans]|uniref:inactive ubiquitin thioesterase OTULINL isoform X3 n=1 Tax=Bufo gargarizans TaxID=30331 RepID=UPI001CF59D8C|nr:inactive ubiquitin thioesterase OTULINL isoform X3 [Bufo gargarizans]
MSSEVDNHHREMSYHRHHTAPGSAAQHQWTREQHDLHAHLSRTSAETHDEHSRMSSIHELITKVWSQVRQCLLLAVAVLFMMWQHFKAFTSLWSSISFQGHSRNTRNLSVNAEVDTLSYCSKKWKREALNAKQIRRLPEKLLYSQGCNWIQQFSFGTEKYAGPKVYGKLRSCLELFKNEWVDFYASKDRVERNKMIRSFFSDETKEYKIYEALKFIMLYLVIEAHENLKTEEQIPSFFHFLFSQDTSADPLSYMMNHLNMVGDTIGLEQAELCLVGYALEVKIKLLRLTKFNKEDFEMVYPADHKRNWHEITLMTDDDRHFNIPVIAK